MWMNSFCLDAKRTNNEMFFHSFLTRFLFPYIKGTGLVLTCVLNAGRYEDHIWVFENKIRNVLIIF